VKRIQFLATMSTFLKEKMGDRKGQFKKGVDVDAARRNREETTIQIRKKKTNDRLNKRRNLRGPSSQGGNAASTPVTDAQAAQRLESLPAMVAGVQSGEYQKQLEATTAFRKLLSIERNPPIQQVIDAGVVPYLVNFLRHQEYPSLQFEAAWALTNIASGTSDHTRVVIDSGSVPIFVALLSSENDDVREQAVW